MYDVCNFRIIIMMNVARETRLKLCHQCKKNISFSVDISDNFKNKWMTPSKLIRGAGEGERVLQRQNAVSVYLSKYQTDKKLDRKLN